MDIISKLEHSVTSIKPSRVPFSFATIRDKILTCGCCQLGSQSEDSAEPKSLCKEEKEGINLCGLKPLRVGSCLVL